MEPMDFDEDGARGHRSAAFRSTSVPALSHPVNSAPGVLGSPFHASQTSFQASHAPFHASQTSFQTSHAPFHASQSVPGLRQRSLAQPWPVAPSSPGVGQHSNQSSASVLHSRSTPHHEHVASLTETHSNWLTDLAPAAGFSRGGTTPVQGRSQSQSGLAWQDAARSPNMSDRSDISEMEVVENSPAASPSWGSVRAAFSSCSLFQSHVKTEAVAPDAISDVQDECGRDMRPNSRTSTWEPTLAVVQSAATFKRKTSPTKKSSPSKSAASVTQASTPIRKLGSKKVDEQGPSFCGDSVTKMRKELKLPSPWSPAEKGERGCGGCCCKALLVFVVAVAVMLALLLQDEAAVRRESFASVDYQLLKDEMTSRLLGQHVAFHVVPQSLEDYLRAVREDRSDCEDVSGCDSESRFVPPLVLSFHGWTGVGKNFVSDIVMASFPAKTVTKFLVPHHFPHQHLDKRYQSDVEDWVLSNVTELSVNFFVFDEMDKASLGVVQGLQNAIAKLSQRDSFLSPVVFLLLSNSFGSDINQLVFQTVAEGGKRRVLELGDFSHVFNDLKESWYMRLRSANAITVSVPFLPLERHHIVQCIRLDLISKQLSTHVDTVNAVLEELTFMKLPSGQEFSQTGCKRVSDKVNLVAFS